MAAAYNNDVITHIKNLLLARSHTIAVAESVTSGHMQVAFSQADNALNFFQGGVTTYNIGQKSRHLKIDPIHAATCNCVSEKIASQMAGGVSVLFSSDWGIGITGYASPVPEENISRLFACYSFSFRGEEKHSQTVFAEKNSPYEVQVFYTNHILHEFRDLIMK